MNRITRILDLNTADKHPKLSNRSFLSGAAALLFAAVSLTTLGASCVNNAAEEGAQLKSDFTKEQFAQRAEKLEAMVESGEISREDADLRHGHKGPGLRGGRRGATFFLLGVVGVLATLLAASRSVGPAALL